MRNDVLQLIILPTEQCNFRCVYCYERFNQGLIRQDVVEGIKNLLMARKSELKYLSVSWFGGEPLLAYNKIIELLNFINSEIVGSTGIMFSSEMTTNAYLLTEERLRQLVKRGVSHYQVSFDGDEEEHNKLRVRADGGPTFARIMQNIIDAHRTPLSFSMMLRVHANSENKASISRLLRRFSENLCGDKRFSMYIRPLSRLGGPNDNKLPIINDLSIIKELISEAKQLGLNPVDAAEVVDDVCYAAKMNSYIIRSDGRVSKCTVALYDDRNIVGRLNPDGTLEIYPNKVAWWSRGIFTGNPNQLACPLMSE